LQAISVRLAESAERADKLREANQNSLIFPFWCSILELVRTHFAAVGGEEIPPRIRQLADGKAAKPHRSKPQKNPEKNIGSPARLRREPYFNFGGRKFFNHKSKIIN